MTTQSENALEAALIAQLNGMESVSYTHLDVYKRQTGGSS